MRQRPIAIILTVLLSLVVGLLGSTGANAAVVPIVAWTTAGYPAPGESVPTTGWYLMSLTSGNVTSTSLVESKATRGSGVNGEIVHNGTLATSGEYLGTSQEALKALLSGPSVTTGLANVPQADIEFQDALGQRVTFSVGDNYRFCFFEYGANDPAIFELLDNNLQPIAGYSLTIQPDDYGSLLPKVASSSPDAILYNNGAQASTTGGGVTFDLDDFNYTGTAPVAGLRYLSAMTPGAITDPMTFVAYTTAAVPEPGSLALGVAGLGAILGWVSIGWIRSPGASATLPKNR